MNQGGEGGDTIKIHGIAVNKKQVQCKYCDKVVPSYNRLKHHLAHVGPDVVKCMKVPDNIMLQIRNDLLDKKLQREVGSASVDEDDSDLSDQPTQPSEPRRSKRLKPHPQNIFEYGSTSYLQAGPSQPTGMAKIGDDAEWAPWLHVGVNGKGKAPFTVKSEDKDMFIKVEPKGEKDMLAAQSIGSFFYEAGIDLNCIKLHSFQKMVDAVINCGVGFRLPEFPEMSDQILAADLREVCEHIEVVKKSWADTGCSILLDSWNDRRGRYLISILVHCPRGTVFLRSVDASEVITDVDTLFLLLSGVIEEVGPQNVVQVISHGPALYMENVGARLKARYRTIFWTLCADYCINLILERVMTKYEDVDRLLRTAKILTRFIYSHELPLQLMKKYIPGKELVRASRLQSVASFLTLQNLMSERENLEAMFNSLEWISSPWANRPKGRTVCAIVNDPSFWYSVGYILKFTNPLIAVLNLINRSDTAPMGFLYASMDQAKEEVEKNFKGCRKIYTPFWKMVDDVWNYKLHSHLHAAAYYLNPSIFYAQDFECDSEVATGILFCIVHMCEDPRQGDLAAEQLEHYRKPSDGFAEKMAVEQRMTVPPGNQRHDFFSSSSFFFNFFFIFLFLSICLVKVLMEISWYY